MTQPHDFRRTYETDHGHHQTLQAGRGARSLVGHRGSRHHRHRGQRLRATKRTHRVVVDFLPKVKIEAAVAADLVGQVIEAIEHSARTGKIGDGKIFVTSLEQVVRIRTGETGTAAI